jgi:iron(III) transport system ATP-binding protein
MKNKLSLKNINLSLDNVKILENINLDIDDGEIVCLLGPSGCGKTSLLRIIAGLEERSVGSVSINQKVFQDKQIFIGAHKRKIGMVFQDYALFPHMNVSENILFGLDHLTKQEQQIKLQEMLELVKLTYWRDAYPHKLSGGQQQRVALARALAQGPELLLLDEPFSSLDTELRYQLSEDVRAILKKLNMTAVMVTHDQTEAFSFADKIGVMKEGRIEQFDVVYDIYHRPKTSFVAGFIGEGVIVSSELIRDVFPELNRDVQGKILIRPDDITHDDASAVKAKVFKRIFRGSHFLYVLDFDNGLRILSLVPSHHEHAEGDYIGLLMDLDHAVAFDA